MKFRPDVTQYGFLCPLQLFIDTGRRVVQAGGLLQGARDVTSGDGGDVVSLPDFLRRDMAGVVDRFQV